MCRSRLFPRSRREFIRRSAATTALLSLGAAASEKFLGSAFAEDAYTGDLVLVGFGSLRQDWLGSADTALWAVFFVDIWKWTGFHLVIYLAGLQSIPKDLYEAALLDGANAFQKFWRITVPLLRPFTAINVLLEFDNYIFAWNAAHIPTYTVNSCDRCPRNGRANIAYMKRYDQIHIAESLTRISIGELAARIADAGLANASIMAFNLAPLEEVAPGIARVREGAELALALGA